MNKNNLRGNIFDSSDGSKEVVGTLRELLNSQMDSIGILRIIVTEIKNTQNITREFLVEIKEVVNANQSILIGNAVDEVGGIKKDVKELITLIKAKTPWFVTAGAIATIVGMFGTMLGMLIKMVELSHIIEKIPR